MMRDVMSIEYGQAFVSDDNIFPSFYCQDLVVFGLENNIAEAVRLGESMMSQNGYRLSPEMQLAVKRYLIDNTQKYNEAIQRTGPIDNASLYKSTKKINSSDDVPTILTIDDPYWQEFLSKNSKRHLSWKLPSVLAWDYKPHGIIGELIDMKQIEKTEKLIRQQ